MGAGGNWARAADGQAAAPSAVSAAHARTAGAMLAAMAVMAVLTGIGFMSVMLD